MNFGRRSMMSSIVSASRMSRTSTCCHQVHLSPFAMWWMLGWENTPASKPTLAANVAASWNRSIVASKTGL